MEQEITPTITDERVSIKYNIDLLKWYFESNKNITSENEKQKVFSILSYSILEEPRVFMRIILYIANTRHSNEQELSYKVLIHFLGTMFPELCLANLDLFVSLGKKDDILFFMQCPNLTERIIKYIKHKAKMDDDFKILLDGTIIGQKIKRLVRYKPKMKLKNHVWDIFLYKILDDPTFNGISV